MVLLVKRKDGRPAFVEVTAAVEGPEDVIHAHGNAFTYGISGGVRYEEAVLYDAGRELQTWVGVFVAFHDGYGQGAALPDFDDGLTLVGGRE